MANGPSKFGERAEARDARMNTLLAQFESRVMSALKGKLPDEDLNLVVDMVKTNAADIIVTHLNLAFYCESPQVQLSAIKELYTLMREGLIPNKGKLADKSDVRAEDVVRKYMEAQAREGTDACESDKLN